ncbi:MAG: metallophosphoesterase, partial [Chloroflexota bacterium]|nr:metallophosphoesterase [Chloroflexota bacterium]
GNHDYRGGDAGAYFDYFGELAGPRDRGYYSYEAGSWHVVVLNSNCSAVGCRRGSEQERWLRADLVAHPTACTLAYWHHPRFSSGMHGNHDQVGDFWDALYEAGADLVVSGHDHDYERFAPMNPAGERDTARGIREIVVGTGGGDLRRFEPTMPNSEMRESGTYGVLKLTLKRGGYEWEFVPAAGATFSDSGSSSCH